jgi:hypothetical protein
MDRQTGLLGWQRWACDGQTDGQVDGATGVAEVSAVRTDGATGMAEVGVRRTDKRTYRRGYWGDRGERTTDRQTGTWT